MADQYDYEEELCSLDPAGWVVVLRVGIMLVVFAFAMFVAWRWG